MLHHYIVASFKYMRLIKKELIFKKVFLQVYHADLLCFNLNLTINLSRCFNILNNVRVIGDIHAYSNLDFNYPSSQKNFVNNALYKR